MKQLSELLRGCRLVKDENGEIIVQSIRNMQIVCLTTDDEFSHDDKFANPLTVLASNRNYGHLNLDNRNSKPVIVPAQIAVLSKQKAQNHGMVKGAYIPAKSKRDFNDAGCIEGAQGGYLNTSDNVVRFIPFGAREYIFERINNTSGHGNIYGGIRKVGEETGTNSGEYLDQYFKKVDKKLEEFIAHFERPPRTIGAIVLVDGEIVAVDKFPSFQYAEQVWDLLIRDCYGAIAITEERKNAESPTEFTQALSKTRRQAGESAASYLKRALGKTKKSIADNVRDRLAELMDETFDEQVDNDSTPTFKSYALKSEDGGYVGQVITESGFNHLVSICKKASFSPERFRAANAMRQKARRQDDFTL